jgi:choline dehydrogenase-like flavoprotein
LKWSGARVIETGSLHVGHGFNAGFGTGGSAMHHYAVWPRLHADDFRMHTRFGHGLDWPIGYDDLRPYYDAVQLEAGISGDAKQETWRPPGAPYPMGPVPVFAQGKVIARGFEKLGKTTAPLPLAVTSSPYNGRAACIWDGWCDAGCPIGALANPLTIHLPKAFASGATLHHATRVTKILTSDDGARAIGVEYAQESSGTRGKLEADLVILAAFSVENPRLLLASANAKHPKGLGNANDILGRYVMSHSAGLVYGLFEDRTEPYMGAFGGQLVNQDSYPKETHAKRGAFGSYQWMIAQAVKPNDLLGISTTRPDLYGDAVAPFMKRAVEHFAGMMAVVEDLPVADNRVTLASERDAQGEPIASVAHDAALESTKLWESAVAEGKEVFAAAGAQEIWSGTRGTMHIMGGTIMGKDPRTSVTDSYGRVHGVHNLYVAGPGLFPTSGGVNPTFTALALAQRAAEKMPA